ncbi:class E sortase [Saccharopolyspora rhizosphaerae]|uniref:Class E sortase n=1 Tax=Saccharopolyspora rhizosphaerae TaxID=2492662 RepID=A0A3R8VAW7_9PSEU|nr:class E sortase [Saccharopolyspora rhizosphaerae]RRO13762.1 class E sortase [Saccharopolyspora rhizosphaerae]
MVPSVESPPRPPRPEGRARTAIHVLGELLITAGLVLLLFVFYVVYVTDLFTAQQQADARGRMHEQWQVQQRHPIAEPPPPAPGEGFAQLHLPTFGLDFTVLEGTDLPTLAAGPGHYPGTAWPGEQGNFSVAGHRNGRGAPFHDLDRLPSCAPLVVETATHWYIYRVLPMAEEVATWDGGGGDPRCQGVAPVPAPYEQVVGRRVVRPEQGEVVFPVPGAPPEVLPPDQRTRLITLTTCHPEFSARERLIVHGVLTTQYPKIAERPDLRPPELEER